MTATAIETPAVRTLWLNYDLGSEAGESRKGRLTAWSPEGVPVERRLASELYGAGLAPGVYRGWVEYTDGTDIRKTPSGHGWESYQVPVPQGRQQVEIEVVDLGREQVFADFREAAARHGLKLRVGRHLTHTGGQHGNWKLTWGFHAVFSDGDKNRLELWAGRTFRDWDGKAEGYSDDAVTVELAVCGKKIIKGAVPFGEWPEKLQLFCDNLETLKAMGALRRGLLNLKK